MKEIIKIGDIANGKYHPDDWEGFKVVQEKVIDSDWEKSYKELEVVIQRKNDKKFFIFNMTWYLYTSLYNESFFDTAAEEVEQKTRTIIETYYE